MRSPLTSTPNLKLDPNNLTSPRQAAAASALSFSIGALLPLVAILIPPPSWRVPVVAVLVALALTGVLSARIGGNTRRAVLRVLIGGALGLAVTYGIGHLLGTALS
jgi:vacuolar iron transporter family protein